MIIFLLAVRLVTYFPQAQKLKNGQQLSITTRITDVPQVQGSRQQFRIKIDRGERITITTGLFPRYSYGDRITIKGKVKTNIYKGHEFFTMNYPTLQAVNNDQNFITRAANQIRRKTDIIFQKSLPPASAGLLSGIVFGGNQGLPKDFMDALRTGGVVHVIAASGMNVTFVAGALIGILGAFLKRRLALTIAILGIVFYAFLSGFEPSIVRAAIMACFAFSAALLGRQNFALTSVFITAGLMLFYAPDLLFDVGFQLSFLATLGILLIKPILDGGLGRLGKLGGLGSENITTTIAAQIATLPILLSVFGSFGMLSILVNALVLWTVPVLMAIGSIGLLLGFIFEPLGKIVLFTAIPILFYFEKTVMYFGGMNLVWTIPEVSIAIWIGYYLLVLAVISFSRSSKKSETVQLDRHIGKKLPLDK